MKKIQHQNIQHQIANLITIIELYLPVIEEINKTQSKLSFLPNELEKLQNISAILEGETANKSNSESSNHQIIQLQETEFQLDSLVNDLEGIFIYLNTFENKLKNLLVLEERLEALQEARIEGITPERISKLLEQQRSHKTAKPVSKSEKLKDFGRKIVNYRHTKKIAVGMAVFVGTIFFTAYNSPTEPQVIESTIIEEKEIDNSTTDI